MPIIGEIIPFIDARGVKHNLIVAGVHHQDQERVSGVYVDEAKAAHEFSTGQWAESVVRVVDAVPHDHKSKDKNDPRNCWVRPVKALDDVIELLQQAADQDDKQQD